MPNKNKILFIAPYRNLANDVLKIVNELGLDIDVAEAVMDDAVRLAKTAEKNGTQIVISRGATAAAIKKECNLTVVEMYESNLEILRAIEEASKYGQNLALIWYNEVPNEEDFIYKLLQVNVRFYKYETKDQIKALVKAAVEENADVIIGGVYTVSFAEMMGKKGVIVECDRNSIIWTLKQAQYMANIKKEEKVKRKRIETIVQNVHDGIIAVDQNGIITTFNPMAESIMKLKASDVIGKKADEVIPNTRLSDVVEGDNQLEQLQDVGTAIISTNRVKMIIQNEIVGAVATFQDVTKIQRLEHQIRQKLYSKGYVAEYNLEQIIGSSPTLVKAKNIAAKFAESEETILLLGESGCGKEMFAQSIHNISRRKEGPFVAVNCAELSNNLFESELFGYEEGSFTGAKKGGKDGLFLLAHGGTIFLDEISELPLTLQTTILRVIQEKVVRPIGSDRIIPINVRIVAASNKNLRKMVDENKFRQDLYYRLNVLSIRIPPLRERASDIPAIIKDISKKSNYNIKFDKETIDLLMNYDWPGNVRELNNVIKRLLILYDEKTITKKDLIEAFPEMFGNSSEKKCEYLVSLGGTLEEIIDRSIEKALEIAHGNQSEAARILGVSRTYLWRKIKSNIC